MSAGRADAEYYQEVPTSSGLLAIRGAWYSFLFLEDCESSDNNSAYSFAIKLGVG